MAALADRAGQLGPVRVVVANAGIAGPTAPLHEIIAGRLAGDDRHRPDGVFLTFRARSSRPWSSAGTAA